MTEQERMQAQIYTLFKLIQEVELKLCQSCTHSHNECSMLQCTKFKTTCDIATEDLFMTGETCTSYANQKEVT